ncbi:hypothetical protein [Pseudomonas sp. Sample_24]|uniref:hypothetical protein n=1 Tax=Pseudomonas sp. Sample_24 TaxID=2448268 RepID=UPI001032A336|nr:hypothetical protein [Pseudomonas sp. Sample_24]
MNAFKHAVGIGWLSGRYRWQAKLPQVLWSMPIQQTKTSIVGVSLLAMVVNDDAGYLNVRIAQSFFASRLAPAGIGYIC